MKDTIFAWRRGAPRQMQPCEKMDAIGVRCSRGCHWHMQTARFIHDYVNLFSPRVGHESIWIIYIIQMWIYGSSKKTLPFCVTDFHPISTALPRKATTSPFKVLDRKSCRCKSWDCCETKGGVQGSARCQSCQLGETLWIIYHLNVI